VSGFPALLGSCAAGRPNCKAGAAGSAAGGSRGEFAGVAAPPASFSRRRRRSSSGVSSGAGAGAGASCSFPNGRRRLFRNCIYRAGGRAAEAGRGAGPVLARGACREEVFDFAASFAASFSSPKLRPHAPLPLPLPRAGPPSPPGPLRSPPSRRAPPPSPPLLPRSCSRTRTRSRPTNPPWATPRRPSPLRSSTPRGRRWRRRRPWSSWCSAGTFLPRKGRGTGTGRSAGPSSRTRRVRARPAAPLSRPLTSPLRTGLRQPFAYKRAKKVPPARPVAAGSPGDLYACRLCGTEAGLTLARAKVYFRPVRHDYGWQAWQVQGRDAPPIRAAGRARGRCVAHRARGRG
jgi:hypothetical protein